MEILLAIDADRMRDLRARGEFYWLDLVAPDEHELAALGELVTIHPLAFEDSAEFGQRVKLDVYEHSALLVFYGVRPGTGRTPRLVEVHLHISAEALVTVHREPLDALADAVRHASAEPRADAGRAVYRVLDALADSFLDALDRLDDAVDTLEENLVENAGRALRQPIFKLRRDLARLRQVVVPQRDLLADRDGLAGAIPGAGHRRTREELRDVHDHLARAAEQIASYREHLASLLDLYLGEVSNRLNVVMKRLTVISTVFLPLTFLTGFFGMNFGWMVGRITPLWTFAVFGVGLLVASAVAVVLYLRRTDSD